MNSTISRFLLLAAVAALAPVLMLAGAARATTIRVDTPADEVNTSGDCALREAVIAANDDVRVDGCAAGNGADTIVLPSGTYRLTQIGTFEDEARTGDLDVTSDLTIRGAGRANTAIDGNGTDRVIHLIGGASLTLLRLTISNGDPGPQLGGGLYMSGNVTIEDSRIRDNRSVTGGGIYVATGTLIVHASRIDDNTANDAGGIYTSGTDNVVHITDSTIDGNAATVGNGGGIWNGGATALANSTVTANSAAKSGGGIITVGLSTAQVTMFSVTIAENIADSDTDDDGDGGGLHAVPAGGGFNARNTLVGDNHDLSPAGDVYPDCSGEFFGVAYNLIEDDTGCVRIGTQVGDVTGLDPALGPLQANGGPTVTRALQVGSPAIDAGNPSGCIGFNGVLLFADQRNFVRNGPCDIGAFEFDSPGAATPTRTPTSTATRTLRPTQTATPTRPTATRPPTHTATRTRTRTATATYTTTVDPSHTRTNSPTPTSTSPTRTSTATRTPTEIADFTGTATRTRTATSTPTHTASLTPTATAGESPASPAPTDTAAPSSPTATPPIIASPSATPAGPQTPSLTPIESPTLAEISATPTPTPSFTPIPGTGECPGDCDDNQVVAIEELVRGINIALGALPVSACTAFDSSANTAVEIAEIVAAVNAALRGCPVSNTAASVQGVVAWGGE